MKKILIIRSHDSDNRSLQNLLNKEKFPAREIETIYEEKFDKRIFETYFDIVFFCGTPLFTKENYETIMQKDNKTILVDGTGGLIDKHKIIVPPINSCRMSMKDRIFCSPRQCVAGMAAVLYPIHNILGIQNIILTIMHPVSTMAKEKFAQYLVEHGEGSGQYYDNIFPYDGTENADGECETEIRVRDELRNLLDAPELNISASCIRVPITESICADVSFQVKSHTSLEGMRDLVSYLPGIRLPKEEPINFKLNEDTVFVERLRKIDDQAFRFFISFDSSNYGAAYGQYLIAKCLVN